MTDTNTSTPDLHPAALLMPWYASGSLPEHERRDVEAHLRTCAACRAELESVGVFRQHTRDLFESQPFPEQRIHDAVIARLNDEISRNNRTSGRRSFVETFLQGLMRPSWAPAIAVALIVVQAGAIAWLSYERSQTTPQITTRGIAPAAARIRIVFNPGATEQDIRSALQTLGGRIVDGPTADGAYIVELPAIAPTELSQRLRALRERPGLIERIENAAP